MNLIKQNSSGNPRRSVNVGGDPTIRSCFFKNTRIRSDFASKSESDIDILRKVGDVLQSTRVNPDLVNPDIAGLKHCRFCNLLLSRLSGPFIPAPDVNYPVFPD